MPPYSALAIESRDLHEVGEASELARHHLFRETISRRARCDNTMKPYRCQSLTGLTGVTLPSMRDSIRPHRLAIPVHCLLMAHVIIITMVMTSEPVRGRRLHNGFLREKIAQELRGPSSRNPRPDMVTDTRGDNRTRYDSALLKVVGDKLSHSTQAWVHWPH